MCDIEYMFDTAMLFVNQQTSDPVKQKQIVLEKLEWMLDVHVQQVTANPKLMDHHDKMHAAEGDLLTRYRRVAQEFVEHRF